MRTRTFGGAVKTLNSLYSQAVLYEGVGFGEWKQWKCYLANLAIIGAMTLKMLQKPIRWWRTKIKCDKSEL